jgi:Flp pilus assembly protein TadG
MKRNNPRHRRQRGTQVVELAIALPLLAFLSMMVAEGSDLLRAHQVINNAAREGARLSSLPENYNQVDGVKSAVVAYAASNGLSLAAANVTVNQNQLLSMSSGVAIRASQVAVTYSYSLQFLPVMPFSTVPPSITLVGTAQFRNLY